ncbi:MAG TPA: translation initiation factor [Thermoanaerobaculia bacterium]|nr:translation initiation factor [Thermoanaerobaculia bacterium]
MKTRSGRTVYSTESPVVRKEEPARREPFRSLPPAEQSPRVRRDKASRGGKTVTVAGPLVLTREDATALLASWKKLCGGGGALKAGKTADGSPAYELEIQGDHADRLVGELVKAGYRAKRSGG